MPKPTQPPFIAGPLAVRRKSLQITVNKILLNFMKNIYLKNNILTTRNLSSKAIQKTLIENSNLIVFCSAYGNYTKIHLAKSFLIESKTLKQVEAMLPEKRFIRIHKSILVNIDYIIDYDGNSTIILQPSIKLKISRRMKNQVLSKIAIKLFG
jgi:two-component system, LytTR family, response regulator